MGDITRQGKVTDVSPSRGAPVISGRRAEAMNEPTEQDDSQTRSAGTDAHTDDASQHHERHDDNPEQHGDHQTGQRQAAENAENELPA